MVLRLELTEFGAAVEGSMFAVALMPSGTMGDRGRKKKASRSIADRFSPAGDEAVDEW